MVATTLTDKLINGGKGLIQELDASGNMVEAALWFYFPEEGSWKLMLSFSNIEKAGPKASYSKVQKALYRMKEKDSLSLDDVALAKPNAPQINLLKIAIKTGPGISGIRFTNNVINGQLISDAYIYRLL